MRFIPLFSGSSGNCSVIQTEKATLLVDAGLTGKAVCGALASAGINPASIDGILVTHDHIDHTRAVGILSRKYDMPVYANAGTWEAMNPIVKQVDFRNVRVFAQMKISISEILIFFLSKRRMTQRSPSASYSSAAEASLRT